MQPNFVMHAHTKVDAPASVSDVKKTDISSSLYSRSPFLYRNLNQEERKKWHLSYLACISLRSMTSHGKSLSMLNRQLNPLVQL